MTILGFYTTLPAHTSRSSDQATPQCSFSEPVIRCTRKIYAILKVGSAGQSCHSHDQLPYWHSDADCGIIRDTRRINELTKIIQTFPIPSNWKPLDDKDGGKKK